jgi:hypothetical protein
MEDTRAFFPLYKPNAGSAAGTLIASVTATASNAASAEVALPGNTYHTAFQQIQIANQTNAWAMVNFGTDTTNIPKATVAAGYPVAPGGVVVVSVTNEVAAASVILATAPGAATGVIFSRGTGL